MLDGQSGPGATRWVSARPDTTEHIVIEFDRPQTISRLVYEVEETRRERTQEVRVEASEDGGRSHRQILVQEYNFSPGGATLKTPASPAGVFLPACPAYASATARRAPIGLLRPSLDAVSAVARFSPTAKFLLDHERHPLRFLSLNACSGNGGRPR
jgi:hypothetical protein